MLQIFSGNHDRPPGQASPTFGTHQWYVDANLILGTVTSARRVLRDSRTGRAAHTVGSEKVTAWSVESNVRGVTVDAPIIHDRLVCNLVPASGCTRNVHRSWVIMLAVPIRLILIIVGSFRSFTWMVIGP